MTTTKLPEWLICPFCAAGEASREAAALPEYMQALAATGGVNRLLRPVASWRVIAPGPGADMPSGLYRRWVCDACRLGVIASIPD